MAAARLMLVALRDGNESAARQWQRQVVAHTPHEGNAFLPRLCAALMGDSSSTLPEPGLRSEWPPCCRAAGRSWITTTACSTTS
jgi:hypothetical protein